MPASENEISPGAVRIWSAAVSAATSGRVILFVVETVWDWPVTVVVNDCPAFDLSVGKPLAAPTRVCTGWVRVATAVGVIGRGPLIVAPPTVWLFGVNCVCVVVVVVVGVIVLVGTPFAL